MDSIEQQVEELLDAHGEYYIRRTMEFFKGEAPSPAITLNTERDLESKQAILQLIQQARVSEVKRMDPTGGRLYIARRLAELNQKEGK